MKIINSKGTIDIEKEAVILMFNNDDELSSFISLLVQTPIKSTGARLLSLIPENAELSPLQISILNIIEGLDGIGGNDNDKVCDNAIGGLNDIIKSIS